jgi:hypothetical protein
MEKPDTTHEVKGTDQNGPPKNIGSFISPQTDKRIYVFAKKGESREGAVKRVKAHHGLP